MPHRVSGPDPFDRGYCRIYPPDDQPKVINGPWGDQNIGMQVFGNVYSNAMLFKVEGKPMHAAEMTDEQLQFRRDQLRRIIKLRRSILSGAGAIRPSSALSAGDHARNDSGWNAAHRAGLDCIVCDVGDDLGRGWRSVPDSARPVGKAAAQDD